MRCKVAYSTQQIREKAIHAYLNGESVISIARVFGVARSSVYRWIERYNEARTVTRKSHPGSGRPRKLTGKDINSLAKMLKEPASVYGFDTDLWSIRRIIIAAKRKLKINLSKSTLHRILCDSEYSYKKPEARYYEVNETMQQEWIKKTLAQIKKCVKDNNAILYFEDEAHVSLACATGKTWGPIGQKTIIKRTGNRGGISAMSAITKKGHLLFNLFEKKITSKEVIDFLRQMLAHHPTRHIVIIMDQARVHTSKVTKDFIHSQKRLHVFYLPARSPEFNPDEKVWNYLKNQELCSHKATNTRELKKLTKRKLRKMASQPSLLRGIFRRCEIADLL